MHKLQEAWRCMQWSIFVSKDRRDAKELQAEAYPEKLATTTRKYLRQGTNNGRRAHLFTGAFKSPFMLFKAGYSASDGKCVWDGCQEIGTQDHIMWGCTCRGRGLEVRLQPRPKPRHKVTARLGWGATEEELIWMEAVVQHTWDIRFPGNAARREALKDAMRDATQENRDVKGKGNEKGRASKGKGPGQGKKGSKGGGKHNASLRQH